MPMEQLLSSYQFTTEQLRKICKTFHQELQNGLAETTHHESSVKCFPTYVHLLPSGNQFGKVLILDLSGQTFRIVLISLKGELDPEVDEEFFRLKMRKMICSGEELFDYLVDRLVEFLRARDLTQIMLPLGVTFPFLSRPQSLKRTRLLRWSKGFLCWGVENEEVAALLEAAIAKRAGQLHVELVAILDSSVGTLVACAQHDFDCSIGCLIGSETKAAYVEKTKRVELLPEDIKVQNQTVIINTEWGDFGVNGCLDFVRTDEDLALDNKSAARGQRIFEKMISDAHLGELVRLVLLRAVRQKLIFQFYGNQAELLEKLSFENVIPSSLIYTIEDDNPIVFEASRRQLLDSHLHLAHIPGEDMCKLQRICRVIGKRSAKLLGLCLGVLINRINQPNIVVAIDGCIYRLYTKYKQYLRNIIRRTVHKDLDFEIVLSEDGEGVGTALMTLVAYAQDQDEVGN